MCVYVAGDMGTVRFIGNVEFADGVWLGIELKKPSRLLFFRPFKFNKNNFSTKCSLIFNSLNWAFYFTRKEFVL